MRIRRTLGPRGTILLALGAFLACAVAGPVHARAQDAPPSVRLEVLGPYSWSLPMARIHLSRSAYAAVFEVEPGIGAVLLYPGTGSRAGTLDRGTTAFSLKSARLALARLQFRRLLWQRFDLASQRRPRAIYVGVASERPLRLGRLGAGHVFAYPGGVADGAEPLVRALLAEVAPGALQGVGASYDVVSFPKSGRDFGLGFASLVGAGLAPNACGAALTTTPLYASPAGFVPGLAACGREPSMLVPIAAVALGDSLAVPARGNVPPRVPTGTPPDRTATDPADAASTARTAELLQRVADARQEAAVDPATLSGRSQDLSRLGLTGAGGLARRMTAQAHAADLRLQHRRERVRGEHMAARLRRLGLPVMSRSGRSDANRHRTPAAPRGSDTRSAPPVTVHVRAASPRPVVIRTPARRAPSHARPSHPDHGSSPRRPTGGGS
ncbi:MAG: hypothetical protein Q8W49_07150 [Candidatus Palauibacterales bacterium]|nr:hypothetical protein [Candidatus Palauibacterales bacterium]MDP2583814.1 hypothetical protein [Candidatus Palauibacterales bacterium]